MNCLSLLIIYQTPYLKNNLFILTKPNKATKHVQQHTLIGSFNSQCEQIVKFYYYIQC